MAAWASWGIAVRRLRLPGPEHRSGRLCHVGARPHRTARSRPSTPCTAALARARSSCGSEEQKQRWLPAMARCEKIGAFGLTEPEVGSGVARGLHDAPRHRDGDGWTRRREAWIGNATFADVTVIWARDVEDGQVKGFVVEKGRRGSRPRRWRARSRCASCRTRASVDYRVAEANRLADAQLLQGHARVLRMTRAGVAWEPWAAPGRLRARASPTPQARAVRPADRAVPARPGPAGAHARQHHGLALPGRPPRRSCRTRASTDEEHASLAKVFCTSRMRETVGFGRELIGGNGILLDHDVGRFVADAEAHLLLRRHPRDQRTDGRSSIQVSAPSSEEHEVSRLPSGA